MRKISKLPSFIMPSQIRAKEVNKKSTPKQRTQSLKTKHEEKKKIYRKRSLNKVLNLEIEESVKNSMYLSKCTSKGEVSRKYQKKNNINLRKVTKADINFERIDHASLFMTKSIFSRGQVIKDQNVRKADENTDPYLSSQYLISLGLIYVKDLNRKNLQNISENSESLISEKESLISFEGKAELFEQLVEQMGESRKVLLQSMNLPERYNRQVKNKMKIEDKITFWMPHNTKLQIYKIELIHTVLKKTSFSLNIFGEIHTKNAIQEICFFSLKLKKKTKEESTEMTLIKENLVQAITKNIMDQFLTYLREYFFKFIKLKIDYKGYLIGQKSLKQKQVKPQQWFIVKLRNKFHLVKAVNSKKIEVQFILCYERGEVFEDMKKYKIYVDTKNIKFFNSLKQLRLKKYLIQFEEEISRSIEKQLYQFESFDMNKNEIKQEKFYVKTRMKTVEEDDNGTFMKRSFKFMGQLQQNDDKKQKCKIKRAKYNYELLSQQIFFKYHSSFDFGVVKQKKIIKMFDQFYFFQNFKQFRIVGVFGDKKISFINIKSQYEKEKLIILNLLIEKNGKVVLKQMKYFIFKKLNQVKSDSRMEYKYVRKKKIFTCLMNEKKKINEIKITSTNSHRVDIHFIEKSDFLRLMNESQRIEKQRNLQQYCNQLILCKKYLYSSYGKVKTESMIVCRKVKRLCHGVFVIFNVIRYCLFNVQAIRFYVSDLQKNYLILLQSKSKQNYLALIDELFSEMKAFYFEEFIKNKNKNNLVNANKKYSHLLKGLLEKKKQKKEKKDNTNFLKFSKNKNKKMRSLSLSKKILESNNKILEEEYLSEYKSESGNNYLIIFFTQNFSSSEKKQKSVLRIQIYKEKQFLIYKHSLDINEFAYMKEDEEKYRQINTEGNIKYQICKYYTSKIKEVIQQNRESKRILQLQFKAFFSKIKHKEEHCTQCYVQISFQYSATVYQESKTKDKFIIFQDHKGKRVRKVDNIGYGFASHIPLKQYNRRLLKRMLKRLDMKKIFN